MRGLVPRIHVFRTAKQDVDGRDKPDKPGHDAEMIDLGEMGSSPYGATMASGLVRRRLTIRRLSAPR